MENAKEMLLQTGKLPLKVTPRARGEGIEGLNAAGELVVKVRVAPEDGKANDAVITLIAKAFDIPKSRLEIIRGTASRHKVVAYR
ncbi:MAG: DUF167 domain-containing protein [Rickettsiales bacterium]